MIKTRNNFLVRIEKKKIGFRVLGNLEGTPNLNECGYYGIGIIS
jgi:hypothetical protein